MRTLVNCIQSPCYKLAKMAAELLMENFRLEMRHNIRNNLELIRLLNKLNIKSNDKLLISLDVTIIFGEITKETFARTVTLQQLPWASGRIEIYVKI